MKTLHQIIIERSYLIWIWLFKNPNKPVEHNPIWRMSSLNRLCCLFENEDEDSLCSNNGGCPFIDTKICSEVGIVTKQLGTKICSEVGIVTKQLSDNSNLWCKTERGYIASKIRRVLREVYPDSEVL